MAATQGARAADMPAPVITPIAPVGSFNFFEGIEVHEQTEAGILFNKDNPTQGPNGMGYNFGHLFTDHAGVPQLNQALLTITKPIDPKNTGYAFGFTAQGLYGTDMRTNHYLGIGTFFMGTQRAQFNLLQGYASAHLPLFTTNGVDVKAGLYASPMGYETLDPSTAPFYSHSYTYNYSLTFSHTGILTTTHISPLLDFWLGVDTGNQTTFGIPNGDPNGQPAGFVGFGLNGLLDGKLTILALSHIGPEQPYAFDPNADKDLRYYNDAVITYKINDDWTSVTELNYSRDEFGIGTGAASVYSAVQYFSYAFAKDYTMNFRAEVLRDDKDFFVLTPTDNSGFAKLELGLPQSSVLLASTGTGTTYSSFTLGVTYKPEVPKPFTLVAVRPEIRYDHVLAGGSPYNSIDNGVTTGRKDQFTFGGDIIIGF